MRDEVRAAGEGDSVSTCDCSNSNCVDYLTQLAAVTTSLEEAAKLAKAVTAENARLRAALADTKENVEYLAEAAFDGDWGVANEEERETACDAVAPFLGAARWRAGLTE